MTTALPPVGAQRAQEIMDLEKEYLLQNYARYRWRWRAARVAGFTTWKAAVTWI